MEVVETGGHRAALRVERAFRDSRIVQDIRLWAGSARIDFVTTDQTPREIAEKAVQGGHTRLPLCEAGEGLEGAIGFGAGSPSGHGATP